jgi:hypothetical protein
VPMLAALFRKVVNLRIARIYTLLYVTFEY